MADELQARLARGDLGALLDPALELEMLAAPNPAGWQQALRSATGALIRQVAQRLRGRTVVRAMDAWLAQLSFVPPEKEEGFWQMRRKQLVSAPSRERRAQMLESLGWLVVFNHHTNSSAMVALGRRLVGLLPRPDPHYEALLEVLERYAR